MTRRRRVRDSRGRRCPWRVAQPIRLGVVLAALVVLPVAELWGQSDPASTALAPEPGSPSFCVIARPLPDCRAHLITEIGAFSRAFGAGRPTDEGRLQWVLGGMMNIRPGDAVGMAYRFGSGTGGHQGGSLRYRRWLDPLVALDLSGGVQRARGVVGRETRPTAGVGVTVVDLVGVQLHWEGGGRFAAGVHLAGPAGLAVGLLTLGGIGTLSGGDT